MFTGIIRGVARISELRRSEGATHIVAELPTELKSDISLGASIALDGVCLTVTEITGCAASFDIMGETLKRTTLGAIQVGDGVNVERAARFGEEIGGHSVSGHVDCQAEIASIQRPPGNVIFTFTVPSTHIYFIFNKGYVAINGVSLTVTNVQRTTCQFEVWFIPETLARTTFSSKRVGQYVNLEVDRLTQVVVETTERLFKEYLASAPISDTEPHNQ